MNTSIAAYCFTLGFIFSTPIYAGDIQGTVKDSKGNPLAHAVVAATPESPNALSDSEHAAKVVFSDDEGHFLLSGLPEGSYGATAVCAGFGSGFIGKLKVSADGVLSGADFALGNDGISISGQIKTSDKQSVKGINVYALRESDDGGGIFYAYVKDGYYRFSLSPGHYTLHAFAQEWEGFSKNLNIPTTAPSNIEFIIWPKMGTTPALAKELISMAHIDQEIRNRAMNHPEDKTLMAEWKAIDTKNETRMKEIVKLNGWPDANLVGPKAAKAAWLMVQHSSSAFLKECLPDMKQAARRGNMDWGVVALSIDRDLMHDGKKQIYGSQFRQTKDGVWEPYPIEDEVHVDQRRAEVGLGSLAEYKAGLIRAYSPAPPRK